MTRLKPLEPFQLLGTQITERVVAKLVKGHQESIGHFRQAEIEVLQGLRSFMEEEVQLLNKLISRREENRPSSP